MSRVALESELQWPSFPSALRPHGASKARLEDFRDKTTRRLAIQLQSNGRMRVSLDGRVYPLAHGSVVLARYENYGHLLLWPDEETYRILPAGSLAALMREGRADVSPLLSVDAVAKPGPDHLGRSTQVWRFESKRGQLELVQAEVAEAGLGGALLCRFLLEWLSIAPTANACNEGVVPVRAEVVAAKGGRLIYTATSLDIRSDVPLSRLISIPPQDARYQKFGLPRPGAILSDIDLSALRANAITGTLTAYNNTRVPAYLLLDGTPVAFISPYGKRALSGISAGQYHAALIDFLGEELLPQTPLTIERSASLGKPPFTPDAGTEP